MRMRRAGRRGCSGGRRRRRRQRCCGRWAVVEGLEAGKEAEEVEMVREVEEKAVVEAKVEDTLEKEEVNWNMSNSQCKRGTPELEIKQC